MTWLASLKATLFPVPPPPSAKRAAPPEPPSLVLDGVRLQAAYATRNEAGPSGLDAFVRASRADDDTELWKAPVYRVTYDQALETDVQDVFIAGLALEDGKLRILDERGRTFMLDLATRAIQGT